jgi:hypothetical protein
MLELRELPEAVKDLMTVAQAGDTEGIQTEWKTLCIWLRQFSRELRRNRKS